MFLTSNHSNVYNLSDLQAQSTMSEMAIQHDQHSPRRVRIAFAVKKRDNKSIRQWKGLPSTLSIMSDDILRRDLHTFLQTLFQKTLAQLGLDVAKQATLYLSIINHTGKREYLEISPDQTDFIAVFTKALNNHSQVLTGVSNLPCLQICFPIDTMMANVQEEDTVKDSGTVRVNYLDIEHIADTTRGLAEKPTANTIVLLDFANRPLRLAASNDSKVLCTVSHVVNEGLRFDVLAIEEDLAWCRLHGSTDGFKFLLPVCQLHLTDQNIQYYNKIPCADKELLSERSTPDRHLSTRGIAGKVKPQAKFRKHDETGDSQDERPTKRTKLLAESSNRRSSRTATQDRPFSKLVHDRQMQADLIAEEEDDDDVARTCHRCSRVGTQDAQKKMVRCDGKTCKSLHWYHFKCVGLSKLPKHSFYCWNCKDEAPRGMDYRERKDPHA